MRYHGTDIDGVFIQPDRLEVRGIDLNDIIRTKTFAGALSHLFLGTDDKNSVTAIGRCLDRAFADISLAGPDMQLVRAAAESGATVSQCVTSGLMAKSRHIEQDASDAAAGLSGDLVEGLHYVSVLPAYVAVAISTSSAEAKVRLERARHAGHDYTTRVMHLFVESHSSVTKSVLEALLVAWHAGFGYLPPSVMMPRISIGTGVAIRQALGAGFAAAGPAHIGACEYAMHLFNKVLAKASGDEIAAATDATIETLLAQRQKIPGFGHPLFLEDPRPICLRNMVQTWNIRAPALQVYDAAVAGMKRRGDLKPNIDSISAGLFIAAGITDPGAGANIAMAARSAGMLAHILERKARPAFGVTSDVARQHLDSLPKDWL